MWAAPLRLNVVRFKILIEHAGFRMDEQVRLGRGRGNGHNLANQLLALVGGGQLLDVAKFQHALRARCHACGKLALLAQSDAAVALVGDSQFLDVGDRIIRACRRALLAAHAHVLVDEHETVLVALGAGTRGARLHAGGLAAVVARHRHVVQERFPTLAADERVHVAVVLAHLQTIHVLAGHLARMTADAVVGGNDSKDNAQFFKGRIRTVKLYSDTNMTSLIAHYDMSYIGANAQTVSDSSENAYDLSYSFRWTDKAPTIDDYAYSFAVVGDTQTLNDSYKT